MRLRDFLVEQPSPPSEIDPRVLRRRTRRDVLLFGTGAIAALAAGRAVLPWANRPQRDALFNPILHLDDDVAEALYSRNRLAPTYSKSEITVLKNNYNGATPGPSYIPEWRLTLDGLVSGFSVVLTMRTLLANFRMHEQITRLVCVEGWSAIAWWAGLQFNDLLRVHPPMPQAKWARIESSVNLDSSGNRDPYFMSLDLPTARHPQTLLATHFNGRPLPVEHGAPLRLLAPVKLGIKNVKAITRITYSAEQPGDYWAQRGYSHYDGI